MNVHARDLDDFTTSLRDALDTDGDVWDHQFRVRHAGRGVILYIRMYATGAVKDGVLTGSGHDVTAEVLQMHASIGTEKRTSTVADAESELHRMHSSHNCNTIHAAKEASRLDKRLKAQLEEAEEVVRRLQSSLEKRITEATKEVARLQLAYDDECISSELETNRLQFVHMKNVSKAETESTRLDNIYQEEVDNASREVTRLRKKYKEEQGEVSRAATLVDDDFLFRTTRAEEDIRKLKLTQLEDFQSQHNMNSMIRTICHEIRNPLQGIISNTELISTWLSDSSILDLNDRIKKSSHDILECALYQSQVLDQLLDFESMHLETTPIDDTLVQNSSIDTMVNRVLSMFQETCKAKGILLHATKSAHLRGALHMKSMQTVLVNFVSNAVKFTSVGSVDVSCAIHNAGDHVDVTISVTDTGGGIDPALRSKLFTAYGVKSTNMAQAGAGLGLRISALLVARVNGKIDFSTSSRGTTFWFTFPLMNSADASTSLEGSDMRSTSSAHDAQLRRVLIVDDNHIIRKLFVNMLREEYICDTACDGAEALLKYRKAYANADTAYDVLLLDAIMPIMSGTECAVAIRETDESTPIMFCSGEIGNVLKMVVDEGINMYLLLKPARRAKVLETLSAVIRNSRNPKHNADE
ncbi:hypothetical protein JKP88DRAFT_251618 [Tribonema minus]|uniref:histidine kinase n=1 Tax=Tribonema minus TaxID=303371 RepID=A0A835ZHA7_9STRA|nr:hypothetical protein JKP88DRAFT_251618 [Tribonema minus]